MPKKRKTARRFSKLNPQRRRLLQEIGKGKNIVRASKAAGYAHPEAAYNALASMRPQIVAALERRGWGPDGFVDKHLVPMLNAKKTLFFADHGIVCDKRSVNDTAARLVAGDQFLKIVGAYAPHSVEVGGKVTFELTERDVREAQESVQRIIAYDSESDRPLLTEVVDD